jgi:ferredoxin
VAAVPDERRNKAVPRDTGSADRRRLLRIGAATAIGGLVLGRAALDLKAAGDGIRASVAPTCAGCTGCVAVCPEAAISVSSGGIEIAQDRCVRCGYCVVVCPVEGVLVHREDGHA